MVNIILLNFSSFLFIGFKLQLTKNQIVMSLFFRNFKK